MLNDDARSKVNSGRQSPAPNPGPDDGIRKTAILIDSLDQPTAETLFAQLPLDLATQVRGALLTLGEVDPQEREQVLAEFLGADQGSGPGLESPEPAPPPVILKVAAAEFAASSAPLAVPSRDDVCRPAVRVVIDAPVQDAERFPYAAADQRLPPTGPPLSPPSPAADDTTAHLARGLAHEHAQTICLVLAQLPPHQATDLLQRLPAGRQAEVLRRLEQLESAAPEVLRELGEALQPWGLSPPRVRAPQPAGSSSVEPDFLPPPGTGRANVRATGRGDAKRLAACAVEPGETPPLTEFDDLMRLDDAALARVFAAAEPATVLLALSGANRDLINRIVRHLPSSAGRTLRRQLESLGPTRLRDIELAQQQLAELASQMCREGLIHVPRRRRFTMAA